MLPGMAANLFSTYSTGENRVTTSVHDLIDSNGRTVAFTQNQRYVSESTLKKIKVTSELVKLRFARVGE